MTNDIDVKEAIIDLLDILTDSTRSSARAGGRHGGKRAAMKASTAAAAYGAQGGAGEALEAKNWSEEVYDTLMPAAVAAGARMSTVMFAAHEARRATSDGDVDSAVRRAREVRDELKELVRDLARLPALAGRVGSAMGGIYYPINMSTIDDLEILREQLMSEINSRIFAVALAGAGCSELTREERVQAIIAGAHHALQIGDFVNLNKFIRMFGDDLDVDLMLAKVRNLHDCYSPALRPRLGDQIAEIYYAI